MTPTANQLVAHAIVEGKLTPDVDAVARGSITVFLASWRDDLLEITRKTPFENFLLDEINDKIASLS